MMISAELRDSVIRNLSHSEAIDFAVYLVGQGEYNAGSTEWDAKLTEIMIERGQ